MTKETLNSKEQNEKDLDQTQSEQENSSEQAEEAAPDHEQEIQNLNQKNNELNDKLLRLAAELENQRKRSRDDLERANKYAISNFASELTTVVENFYLSQQNSPKEAIETSNEVKNFVDAIDMTKKELTKILEKNGIKRVYPLNEPFNHDFHEAISQVPAQENQEEGVVVQVIQAGYLIQDRLIRPALVAVSTKI